MQNNLFSYSLDSITGDLLLNKDTAMIISPYLMPLQVCLQTDILPEKYQNLTLREILSGMQLSEEILAELASELAAVPAGDSGFLETR